MSVLAMAGCRKPAFTGPPDQRVQLLMKQWEMVPRSVFLVPLQLPPGEHEITVDFPDAGGLHQTWCKLVAPPIGEATYFFRMMRGQEGPFTLLPPGTKQAEAR